MGDTNGKAMIRTQEQEQEHKISKFILLFNMGVSDKNNIFNNFHLTFVINNCVSSDSSNSRNGPMMKIRPVQSLDSQPLYFSMSPPAQGSATL